MTALPLRVRHLFTLKPIPLRRKTICVGSLRWLRPLSRDFALGIPTWDCKLAWTMREGCGSAEPGVCSLVWGTYKAPPPPGASLLSTHTPRGRPSAISKRKDKQPGGHGDRSVIWVCYYSCIGAGLGNNSYNGATTHIFSTPLPYLSLTLLPITRISQGSHCIRTFNFHARFPSYFQFP